MLYFAQSDSGSWGEALLVMIGVGVLMVAAGSAVIAIAERAADGRLGPNGWAGTRTKATTSSPEAWKIAHEVGRAPSVAAGWLVVLGAPAAALLSILFASGNPDRAVAIWGILITVLSLVMLGPLLYGVVKSDRAAKAYRDGEQP